MSLISKVRLGEHTASSIEQLIEDMANDYSKSEKDIVRQAYAFSEKAHEGQIRRSGEPYIQHPLGVSSILVDLRLDTATVVTGLLHDTIEDTEVTLEQVTKQFGEVVSSLVDGVTKISQMRFRNTHEKQGENIRKMIVAMGKDVRVVLVKLADRLHNMRTLNHMPYKKQSTIAKETLDIYAPLASRLGISSLKIELEDLGFRYSMPSHYYELAQKIDKKRRDREKYIDEVRKILSNEIGMRTKFRFEAQGRPKHLYSIFKKMQIRHVDYDQVYDILAFRICTESIPGCYEILGIVHSLWKPIPGRFKDFIAMPKANNYQSLHTTVIGPGGERIEVQIRTYEMHRVAEWGIAAHWNYKEETLGSSTGKEAIDKFNWLRELVSLHQQTNNSDEFLEDIKTDLMESEVYVFTPKGEVKEFPDGATPIDFAYSIHTDIGHTVMAARVNGKIISLRYQLKNGDTVDIITSKNQSPSKDWLKYCVTSKAKSKIRAHVKVEQRERAHKLGMELLEKSFRNHGLNAQKQLRGPRYEKFLKDIGCYQVDDLYVRVGYGKTAPRQVVEAILPDQKDDDKTLEESSSFMERAFKVAANRKRKSSSLIRVGGMDEILVHYAKCCNPIPGDPIIGFITLGRGVTIHGLNCPGAYELDQARRIDVEWSHGKSSETVGRMVRVRLVSHDIPGLLKNMTDTFVSCGVNIHNAQIRTTRDKKAICLFDVDIRDTSHLEDVMQALQKIKGVISVSRSNSRSH